MPAFLFIGWGRSLPALGLGLLLYAFGEWPARAGRGTQGSPELTVACPAAAAVVVPCLSSVVASYGEYPFLSPEPP